MFKFLLAVVVSLFFVGAASATGVIGSGHICETFTPKDSAGKVTICTPIVLPKAISNLDGCRNHFEQYLKQKDVALFVVSTDPNVYLQPSSDKKLLSQGTPTNAFTDFRSFVSYSCTTEVVQSIE